MNADGATVNPYAENTDTCKRPDGEGKFRNGAHIWSWVWKNAHMTDTVQCTACGEIRENTDGSNATLVKGTGNDSVQR